MPNQEPAFTWPFGNGPVRVGTQGLFRLCLKTDWLPLGLRGWADIRVAWLVYLACLRSHILRAYCNLESKQASSISLFGRRPNKYCHGKAVSRGTGSPHNLPVCNRLLFYSKCTVLAVCFIYSDISPSMYWNHCQINVELPYMWYFVVLLPQKRFFKAILKEFVYGE